MSADENTRWRETGAGDVPRRGFHLRSKRAELCPSFRLFVAVACMGLLSSAHAEDGYRLWLRYEPINDENLRRSYHDAARNISLSLPETSDSSTLAAAREELTYGIGGPLGLQPQFKRAPRAAELRWETKVSPATAARRRPARAVP